MKRYALCLVLALIFLEWLDFSLYLYLAKTVFSARFFPASSLSLVLSFALFAAGYFARPVGGWLFGRRADRLGRRKPMVSSAALMGLATLGICLLPEYNKIGLWATWSLLLLRIMQGLALGGEINTSAMFLVEHHPEKPLFAGSFSAAAGALGMFIGGAAAAILHSINQPELWRIIFAVVGAASLLVCRLRKKLSESPEFQQQTHSPQKIEWLRYKWNFLNIAAVGIYVSVTVYMCNVFWVSFAIDQRLMAKELCSWSGSLAQLGASLLALAIARLAKPEQACRLLHSSMITAALTAPLLFYFTYQHNLAGVFCALAGYVLANGLLCSALFYFLYLQLPVQIRCQGVSTTWSLAASIGALALPLAAQGTASGYLWVPGCIVSLVAVCALILCRESRGKETYYLLRRKSFVE
ncbi:MFS transporter [Legionella dresdenensis]|uniref:MFS transporter n=1 Tax=Legionella dresdenensis TaxID=450200 RepID=A0ABV8CD37_9GAMM